MFSCKEYCFRRFAWKMEKKKFLLSMHPNQLLWVKVSGSPYWPTRLVEESIVSAEVRKAKPKEGGHLVEFFADNTL